MNREIKFRAWNKHANKMIKSVAILGIWEKFVTGFDRDYIHNSQDWGSQDDFAYDFELMQFTGLQDKNGMGDTCLYEGDILSLQGKLIGNEYENTDLLKDETNFIIKGIGTKNWRYAEKTAMDRGWGYPV